MTCLVFLEVETFIFCEALSFGAASATAGKTKEKIEKAIIRKANIFFIGTINITENLIYKQVLRLTFDTLEV